MIKYKYILTLFTFAVNFSLLSQNTPQGVSIANEQVPPAPNAMLDVVSTNKGVLIPRVTYSTIMAGGALAKSVVSLNTDEDGLLVYVVDEVKKENQGFWYFDRTAGASGGGGKWVQILNSESAGGSLWKQNPNYENNIYYNKKGATVMINGNINPTDPTLVENIKYFPLQIFTLGDDNIPYGPIKFGGGGTANPANTSIVSAHYNEINFDNGSLDLQFWNKQDVNIGSFSGSADLHVYGQIFNSGGVVTSDSSSKTNISLIDQEIDIETLNEKLKKVNLYSFEYKSDLGVTHYGVIAQQLERVFPEMIRNYDMPIYKDKQGKNITKPMKGVDYESLSIVSLQALKQLIIENKDKEIRIEKLESQLQDLLNRVQALEK